jgi:hypothetical protein
MLIAAAHESACGTERTCRDVRVESAVGGKADYMYSKRVFPGLTHERHRSAFHAAIAKAGHPSHLKLHPPEIMLSMSSELVYSLSIGSRLVESKMVKGLAAAPRARELLGRIE